MRKCFWNIFGIALSSSVLAAPAAAQQLAPLGDPVEKPLLPEGVSNTDVEMFGEIAFLWNEPDGTNAVFFDGDFELQLGRRRLYAREAACWLTRRTHDGLDYIHFEIVLLRDAKVVDAAGTVTRGPALFVTLNSSGSIRTSADRKTMNAPQDQPSYGKARQIRDTMRNRLPDSETAPSAVTVLDLAEPAASGEPEVRPAVSYYGRSLTIDQLEDRPVVTVIGDVYVFRGESDSGLPIELRADSAVIFLAQEVETPEEDKDVDQTRPDLSADGASPLSEIGVDVGGVGVEGIERVDSVYLEGDVVLTSGDRMVRASRMYYDFASDKALILDAVIRAFEPKRDLPVYLRAEEIRQLSATEFSAKDARLSTSEFYTPHYHLGAGELTIVDLTPRDPLTTEPAGLISGSYKVRDATVNLDGVPLVYWPFASGTLEDSESGLQSIRSGYSDDFGVEFQSRWELFNILGLEKPVGFDGSLRLDYFSERGPATGIDMDYETDNSFGLLRSYYVHDTGDDNLGGRLRDEDPDTENRGRYTLRHRHYLPNDWQLTFELSYISDKNFLEEWFEREFDQGKDQETLVYLKKQVDNWAFTAHLQYQILDFVTTTERLPEFAFRLIGESLGDFATFFSENRAGFVRFRGADRELFANLLRGGREQDSGSVARGDTRQEIEIPFTVGDLRIVPFGSVRGTGYDDTPDGGGDGRFFGAYGVRASMYAWKVLSDVRHELLDIDGLRHIIKADVVAWGAHSNRDSNDFYEFDENVDGIDEIDGVSVGVRQRFQTRRGGPDKRRTVDVLTLDLEMGLFNDAENDEFTNGFVSPTRPENSVSRNYVNAAAVYRVNDSTNLSAEMNYDLNDGEMDIFSLTYAVERSPRLSYLVGYRFIEEIDSNLLGAGVNYKISDKYTVAVREEFDIERGETAEFDVGVIRKFPRWFVGVTFALDEVEDDVGVSISAWPEGLPRAALGNRRFTGLATSTGIRPGMN